MKTRAEIIQKLIELRQRKRDTDVLVEVVKCSVQMEILKWVIDEQVGS